MFDVENFENQRLRLGFGVKTDGHMISILFQKTAINFIPQYKKEIKIQKTRQDMSNWKKGLYLVYKNLFGITENYRIIELSVLILIW